MAELVDLNKLPAPDVVKTFTFEEILSRRKQQFIDEYPESQRDYWVAVLDLESEPIVKLLEECAYSEMLWRQQLNESAQAVMLAYARGADLDNLAANVNLKRFVIVEENLQTNPPQYAEWESDDALRLRVQSVYETLSTAGSEASYNAHVKNAHAHIADVQTISPQPAFVEIGVLSNQANGVASAEILAAVRKAVNAEHVRPIADRVTVKSAEIINYSVNARLYLYPTPDYEPILQQAKARLSSFVQTKKMGRDVARSALIAALHVEGVQRVELLQPENDIVIAPLQAAFCTAQTVIYAGENE